MTFLSSDIHYTPILPCMFCNTYDFSCDEDLGIWGILIKQSSLFYDPAKSDLWRNAMPIALSVQKVDSVVKEQESSTQELTRARLSPNLLCPIELCKNREFEKKGELKKHIKAKHLKLTTFERPFACPVEFCEHRAFSQKSDLQHHILNNHKEIQELALAVIFPKL